MRHYKEIERFRASAKGGTALDELVEKARDGGFVARPVDRLADQRGC